MNNKNKSGPKSVLEKRGFYTALYSCIAIVLIMAVGITYSSLTNSTEDSITPRNYAESSTAPETVAESNIASRPSAQATDRGQAILVEEGNAADILPGSSQSSKPVTAAAAPSSGAIASLGEESYELGQSLEPVEEAVPVLNNSQEPLNLSETQTTGEAVAAAAQTSAQALVLPESLSEEEETRAEADVLADPVFNTYTGNDDMLWPVAGEVVMEFSVDRLVYDKTLDQYRVNDNICIGAVVGEQVKASADGVIRSITKSREMGNTIVIEHGNGWFTTYSQLQDGILVDEGDVVSEGQVIGGVGEPSIYSTLLGSHLSFKVVKDDAPVDPNLVLALN